jgi:hypothetical protein
VPPGLPGISCWFFENWLFNKRLEVAATFHLLGAVGGGVDNGEYVSSQTPVVFEKFKIE